MAASAGLVTAAAARAPQFASDPRPDAAMPPVATAATDSPPAADPARPPPPAAAPVVPPDPMADAVARRDDPPARPRLLPPDTIAPRTPPSAAGPDSAPSLPSGMISLIAGPGAPASASNAAAVDLPAATGPAARAPVLGPPFGAVAARPVAARPAVPISLPAPRLGADDPVLVPPIAIGSPILLSAPVVDRTAAVPEPLAVMPLATAALLARRRGPAL